MLFPSRYRTSLHVISINIGGHWGHKVMYKQNSFDEETLSTFPLAVSVQHIRKQLKYFVITSAVVVYPRTTTFTYG